MPSYDRRPAELTELVNRLPQPATPEELTRMKQGVDEYAADRNRGLESVANVFADTSPTDKGGEFDVAVEFVRLAVVADLDTLLIGIAEPSHPAWLLREKALVEDDRFFARLTELELGKKYDQMVALNRNLGEMIKALDAKWLTATDEDRQIEEIERQAAKRMNEAVRKAIDEIVPTQTRIAGALGQVVEEMAQIPDAVNEWIVQVLIDYCGISPEWAKVVPKISEPGKDVFEEAKKLGMPAQQVAKLIPYLTPDFGMRVSDHLKKSFGSGKLAMLVTLMGEVRKTAQVYLLGSYAEAKANLLRQLPNEGVIITTISRTRQGVDEFIRNNGVDAGRKLLDEAVTGLDRWTGDHPSDGLKADATTLAGEIKKGFGGLFQEMERTFETFVRDNKGRFFGPVSSEVQEKLLNLREWSDTENELLSLHLDDRLREWRDQALAVEPGLRDAFKQVQSGFAHLPVNIQTALAEALNAEDRRTVQEINAITTEQVALLKEAEEESSPEEIKKTFDRSHLKDQLTR